jgi:hypothetical protein
MDCAVPPIKPMPSFSPGTAKALAAAKHLG